MTKYHVNPATGRINICRASVKSCPVSGADDHYDSKEAAYAGREEKLTQELGTFSPVIKSDPQERKTQEEIQNELNRMRIFDAAYSFGLVDEIGDDTERIAYVADKLGFPYRYFHSELMKVREGHRKELAVAQEKYDAALAKVVSETPEKLRRNLIVAVKSGEEKRLMRIASARGGKISGPTVMDGELYEELYMESVDVSNVIREN